MSDLVSILDGYSFVSSGRNGDIDPSPQRPSGLFAMDTRFLSRWVLTINGKALYTLATDDIQYYEARFYLVPDEPAPYLDAKFSVIRHRWVGGSFRERISILNHATEVATYRIRLAVESDFADLFEVKNGAVAKVGNISTEVREKELRFTYRRKNFLRETVITTSDPAEVDERGFTWTIEVAPHAEWSADVQVETFVRIAPTDPRATSVQKGTVQFVPNLKRGLDEWLARMPKLTCDSDSLREAYRRSLIDLKALQFYPPIAAGKSMLAAGLPWFMTGFGRDALIVALQTLPFMPDLTATRLRVISPGLQGSRLNDYTEEEPGKIFHEGRQGESCAFEEEPHAFYWGAADTTPLFVITIDEYERWTGDAALVREMEHAVRLALAWIDTYANLMGDGYIWYQRRNERNGLENQCWKDSPDSISYRDGRLPGLPRATCEMQGYAYDAKLRAARLARQFWNDANFADQLEREAAELKERFNRDWWIDDGQYYALALDGSNGCRVDALASNMGHLLWSGIVEESRAEKLVDHLLGERMFSGWGVRTLAEGEGRYSPLGYHVGTVWPFDNSIIAWGLRRYGFMEEAARVARGIIDAAPYFGGRLPEAFAGYPRERTVYPVEYPTACSPQAWSSGATLLLIRTILGLEPQQDRLMVGPELPVGMGRIELLNVPGRWGLTDVCL